MAYLIVSQVLASVRPRFPPISLFSDPEIYVERQPPDVQGVGVAGRTVLVQVVRIQQKKTFVRHLHAERILELIKPVRQPSSW
jgi:hypothetical protein